MSKPRCADCFFVVPAPHHYLAYGRPVHRQCLATLIVRDSVRKVWGRRAGDSVLTLRGPRDTAGTW